MDKSMMAGFFTIIMVAAGHPLPKVVFLILVVVGIAYFLEWLTS